MIIRIRPLSSSEVSLQGYGKCVKQESCQTVTWTGHPESRFTFDLVADENVSQVVFSNCLRSLVALSVYWDLIYQYNRRSFSKLLDYPWWITVLEATTVACLHMAK